MGLSFSDANGGGMRQVTLGLIVGNRDVFPAELAKQGREEMIALLKKESINLVVLTPEGHAGRRGHDVEGRGEVREALPRQLRTRSTGSSSPCRTSATSAPWRTP